MMTENQAWVSTTCDAGSPDDSTWQRHRLGGITIAVPPTYTVSRGTEFSLILRAGRGTLAFTLHRNARYLFDDMNYPRLNQNWCNASFSGYATEVIGWYDRGLFGLVARWDATWGGEDAGKWLFARMTATRVQDARVLRSVLHTIRPVQGAGH